MVAKGAGVVIGAKSSRFRRSVQAESAEVMVMVVGNVAVVSLVPEVNVPLVIVASTF